MTTDGIKYQKDGSVILSQNSDNDIWQISSQSSITSSSVDIDVMDEFTDRTFDIESYVENSRS